jgi:hypothetical protein
VIKIETFTDEEGRSMNVHTLPNVLVTTDWVAQHPTSAAVRVVEVDVDTTAYRPLCWLDEKV